FLGRRLRPLWEGQQMVGILLPPCIPGALVNFAAMLMGKTPVNLNYTASNEILESCAKQCGIKTVLTSKAFLEKLPFAIKPPGEVHYMEDVAANTTGGERFFALLMAFGLPAALLCRALGRE